MVLGTIQAPYNDRDEPSRQARNSNREASTTHNAAHGLTPIMKHVKAGLTFGADFSFADLCRCRGTAVL